MSKPTPIEGKPGWYRHDGGPMPVHKDTFVAVPCGTYASLDTTGLMFFFAASKEWEDHKIPHLRDEIQAFCIVNELPEETKQKIRDRRIEYAEKRDIEDDYVLNNIEWTPK